MIALAAVFLAAAVQLEAARERAYPKAADTEESLYLRSGLTLKRLTGAYNALFADLYWIRTIQHYGGTKNRLDASRAGENHARRRCIRDCRGAGDIPIRYRLAA